MEEIRIMIGGDTIPTESNTDLFIKGDAESIFGGKICEMFSSADYSILDLEGCFTESSEPKAKPGPIIKAPVSSLSGCKNLGLSCAMLANTHFMDFGKKGFCDTTEGLEREGIAWFGAGEDEDHIKSSHSVTIKGTTFTFYTVTEVFFNAPGRDLPGVSIYDGMKTVREIEALKKECDYLVAVYHGGIERLQYPRPVMRKRLHEMADAGADIVLMQHNHAIGAEEYYNDSYILYGQGNFCFNLSNKITATNIKGLLMELIFSDKGFEVKKHLVRRTDFGCTYDEEQDLSDFDERSALLKRAEAGDEEAEQLFLDEFRKVSENWTVTLLSVFRGEDPEDEKRKEELSADEFRAYLISKYPKRRLLALKMFAENPEFNETMIRILDDLLKRV